MKEEQTGVSIFTLLFIIFVILKLTGTSQVASWSWIWVTSPLWLPFVVALGLLIIILIICIIFELIGD